MSEDRKDGGGAGVPVTPTPRRPSAEEFAMLRVIRGADGREFVRYEDHVKELAQMEADRRASTEEFRERLAVVRGQRETYRKALGALGAYLVEVEARAARQVHVPAVVFYGMLLALVVLEVVSVVGRVF